MAKLVAGFEYTDAELLALWREAYAKLSVGGQAYSIGSRTLTRADLGEIREQIDWLERRVTVATTGPIAMSNFRRVRPGSSADSDLSRTGDE